MLKGKKESILSVISEDNLIDNGLKLDQLYHLAKEPILNNKKIVTREIEQLYVWGYNIGGRPNGIWMALGNKWLRFAKSIDSDTFPVCCYIYEVTLKPDAKILYIRDDDDLENFNQDFPGYWPNLDYFDFSYIDYLTGKEVKNTTNKFVNYSLLKKKKGQPLRDVLIKNNIIFDDPDNARKYCKFYNNVDIPIERFECKDWSVVAQKYQGAIFETWDKNNKLQMWSIWYQSLDIPSGCIWDINCIDNMTLRYNKIDTTNWKYVA